MSGIVGLASFDGTPIDGRVLRRMTDLLAYRGPDRQQIWIGGSAGLGHALLCTASGSEREEQPASIDGAVWITADARVDGKAALVEQLEGRGCRCPPDASDAHLILHAYRVWGEECVGHLLGDFAFAIWDRPRSRLFCARDHFGVKPFFYASAGAGIVFGNDLDCVRMHPEVADDLNELAVGDFLLFGLNQDPAATIFENIRRLPPAHCLTCEFGRIRSRRYWTLPTDGWIRYRRADDYVDHFRELLGVAVADRLRTDKVGVWMSGGLDSTAITATARRISSGAGPAVDLRAHTVVYDTLIPDQERDYAQLTAKTLGVPIDFFVADTYRPFERGEDGGCATPEPSDDPFLLMNRHQYQQAAVHNRVLLCGEGGDEVLWGSSLVRLLGKMRPLELAAGIARSVLVYQRRPAAGIRSTMQTFFCGKSPTPHYPVWLNTAFTDRFDLRNRWTTANQVEPKYDHPVRPEAYWRLLTAPWSTYFESNDPGVTRVPVEGRYPFLDVRVVGYLLAIPPVPWCVDKQLLRLAMRGALPDAIRRRPKTPLASDPLFAHYQNGGVPHLARFDASPDLMQYVDQASIPPLTGDGGGVQDALPMRPFCLNYWLSRVRPTTL
jgi:asparagine synthase (glutamine-hydrolysing)